nr:MAG TPA: major capsid protein [Caudoviricetes sp.]
MPDILNLISDADRLEFSQNISVARPAYIGDRIFPDQKTQNLKAEYLRLAEGANIPVMATVHAFDTEAEIGTRPVFDKTEVEKLLIKRKINQTERVRLLTENGVYADDAIVRYVFDDMRQMADAVKVRTEVAKMEVLATGKMTIKENNLNMTVDYGVPTKNTGFKIDFGPDADIIGQIMAVADAAAKSGNALTEIVTSTKILRKLAANKGIQTLIYGTVGAGTYVPAERIRSLFAELFGFGVITTNDLRYKTQTASGNEATKRFFPEDKMAFLSNGTASSFGVGLWGVTPEEADYGQYTDKSMDQYITITQWATPDPVAVWTKASGVFIPVVPNPTGLFIAADTSK